MRKAILMMVLAVVSNSAICANRDNLIKNDDVTQQIELAKQFVLAKVFFEYYAKNHPISDAKPDQRERLQLQSIEKVKAELRAKAKIKTISSAETAALVNGVPIPQARINLRVKIEIGEGKTDSPELRKAMQEKMIDLELVVQEATKLGLDKNEEVVQQIELAKRAVLVGTFLQDYVKNHPISEGQLKQEYDALSAKLGNKEYNVRHILVGTEAEAREIIAQLDRGGIFEKLAEKSKDTGSATQGGSLGWAVLSNFVPPFANAVLSLRKGEKTKDPVQTQFGWHIIMVEDIRDLKVPSFDELKTQLQQRLQLQSIAKVTAELRAKAKIVTTSSAKTAALVNGVPIPQARINLRAKIEIGEGKTDSPEFRKAILNDMINVEILAQEAVKHGKANVSNSAKAGSVGENDSVAASTNTKEIPHKTKELITFKGVPLGQPGAKDALMKMCYEVEENKHRFRPSWDTHLSEDVCLFEEFPTQFIVKNYGNMVNKKANFSVSSDGALLEIEFIKTYKESALALAELLESKYGVPTKIRSTVENGMGTKFENITFVWEDDQGSRIIIDSMYEKIDQGRVLIQSSGSVAARNASRKKTIEIDKSNL